MLLRPAISTLSVFFIPLFLSTTAFAGWERIEIPDVDSIHDLSFIDDSTGLALMDGSFDYQVLYTTNGGLDWAIRSESEDDLGTVGSEYARIHLLTPMEGYLIAIPPSSAPTQDLLHTTDAGATFDPVPSPFEEPHAGHFFSVQDFWLTGRGNPSTMVARTTNGGVSWATRETPILFQPTDIWFLDQIHGWIIGAGGNVLRTSDGGDSWQTGKYESSNSARTVRFGDSMHGWMVGENGLFMATVDGGATWVQVLQGYADYDFNDLEVLSSNWVMVSGHSGGEELILVTSDGGVNWFPENTPNVGGLGPLARGGDTMFTGGGDDPAVVVGSGPRLLLRRKVGTMQSPTILTNPLGSGVLGVPYEHPVTAYDGAEPYTWSLASKGAPGISIDPQTGVLSGTPTSAGGSALTIQVEDSNGATDAWTTSLRVASEALSIARPILPSATHRLTYRASLGLEGGNPPYAVEILTGELPYGMTVDEEGVVAGVPQEVGNFSCSVRFSDSSSPAGTATANLMLTVDPLLEARWEVQHAHNRIMDIHFFDEHEGIAIGWTGVFYDTVDGGKTWNLRLFEPGGEMTGFDWIGDEGWMTSRNQIFHSTDRGQTWTFQAEPLFRARDVAFFDSLHGCALGTGIAYTEDGGATWHPAQVPSSAFVFDIDFGSLTHAWAGGEDGLFMRSTDSGKNWTIQNLPEVGIAKSNGITINRDGSVSHYPEGRDEKGNLVQAQVASVFFLNDQVGWVGTNLLVASQMTRVYHTVNGGETWTNQTVNRQVNVFNIQFMEDGQTGFASGLFSERVWRTTNGGATWASMNMTGSGGCLFWGMEFLDADTGWICYNLNGDIEDNLTTNMEGSIWKTEDGARTFFKQYGWDEEENVEPSSVTSRTFGPDIWRIHFFDPANALALGKPANGRGLSFELYRTENAGATWKSIGTVPSPQDIAFLDENHFWAYPSAETLDGGRNWIPRSNLVPGLKGADSASKAFNTSRGVFFLDDHNGWLKTSFFDPDNFFQETNRVLRTHDGGAIWEIASTQLGSQEWEFFFIDEQNGYRFATADFRRIAIEVTTDGGETWDGVFPRESGDAFWEPEALFAPNTTNGWAVGDNGIAATQIDGSTQWEEVLFPEDWVLHDVEYNLCTGGLIVGGEEEVHGPPVILQSTDEHFTLDDRVMLPLRNHELRSVEIVDSANIYAYGGFGLGLKYAAPTDALMIATDLLPEGREGSPYSFQLEALHATGPATWELCVGTLPEGIDFSVVGAFSGTPIEAGDFKLVIAVSDSQGMSASKKYTFRVVPQTAPAIVPETLPNGAVGVPYAAMFSASGTVPPYSWTLVEGDLPPGFDLARLGFFGGTTQLAGTYQFEVEVQDAQSPRGRTRKAYALTIEGELDPGGGPCDDQPIFCLALDWKATGAGLESDRTQDQSVDARDALEILGELRTGK